VGPTTISVWNPGCQDLWLLVGAGTGSTQPPPPDPSGLVVTATLSVKVAGDPGQ